MWEKLKEWLGIITKYKVATQRQCLAGFLVALAKADKDEDGQISVKELLSLYKDTFFTATFSTEMPDSEIIARVESFLKVR